MTSTPRTRAAAITIAMAALASCDKQPPDAYGNFEATEVTVAAEATGRLLHLAADEGTRIQTGALVAVVDTGALVLQRKELAAQREAQRTRRNEVAANAAALETQRTVAQRELERTRRLLEQQAATSQQGDRAQRDVDVLGDQIQGTRASRTTIDAQVSAIDAQLATLDDRIRRSRVVAPSSGTVLTRFAEAGEFVQAGAPLFKMAPLDTLTLRAYVSGAQLAQLSLGQNVRVRVDAGADSLRALEGRITWIASSAEFTPTPIQTRDERTTQVYAVKVAVPNADGRLRIGMPGELLLAPSTANGAKP